MAKKAKAESPKVDTLEKIARLLAALAIKDMKDDKAAPLSTVQALMRVKSVKCFT